MPYVVEPGVAMVSSKEGAEAWGKLGASGAGTSAAGSKVGTSGSGTSAAGSKVGTSGAGISAAASTAGASGIEKSAEGTSGTVTFAGSSGVNGVTCGSGVVMGEPFDCRGGRERPY